MFDTKEKSLQRRTDCNRARRVYRKMANRFANRGFNETEMEARVKARRFIAFWSMSVKRGEYYANAACTASELGDAFRYLNFPDFVPIFA